MDRDSFSLGQAVQGPIQNGLKYFQEWDIYSFSGMSSVSQGRDQLQNPQLIKTLKPKAEPK